MSLSRFIDILKQLRRDHPSFSLRLNESAFAGRWAEAVGAGIAKHTRVIRIENQMVYVEVDHPLWKAELHYRKRQILDKLLALAANDVEGSKIPVIEDIRFVDVRSPTGLSTAQKVSQKYNKS